MLNALFDGLLLVLDPFTEDILVSIGDKGFNVLSGQQSGICNNDRAWKAELRLRTLQQGNESLFL